MYLYCRHMILGAIEKKMSIVNSERRTKDFPEELNETQTLASVLSTALTSDISLWWAFTVPYCIDDTWAWYLSSICSTAFFRFFILVCILQRWDCVTSWARPRKAFPVFCRSVLLCMIKQTPYYKFLFKWSIIIIITTQYIIAEK